MKQANTGDRTLFVVGINVTSSLICGLPEHELINVAELDRITSNVGEIENGTDSYKLNTIDKTSDLEEFGVQNTIVPGAIQIMPKQHQCDIGTISDAPSTQDITELEQRWPA